VTYFEVRPRTPENKLIAEMIMQYLNEPFFNDLRTNQQLGYVVFSRIINTRDVIGV